MLAEKQSLTLADLDAQTALLLPERETPVTVIIGCVGVCVGSIRIQNVDISVVAQVCAAVNVLNVTLLSLVNSELTCIQRSH